MQNTMIGGGGNDDVVVYHVTIVAMDMNYSNLIVQSTTSSGEIFRLMPSGSFRPTSVQGYTVCPRSSDPFYIISYYIKWVTTSWTNSKTKYEKSYTRD